LFQLDHETGNEMSKSKIVLLFAGAALLLAGCDNGPSAVAQKQAAGTQMAANAGDASADTSFRSDSASREDHRRDPVPEVDGKPMWSASRKFSAQQNAQRSFDRNGEAFGADSLDEFVEKAHGFVSHPPKGTLTMTRNNGDKLFYDPKANVFAVASKAGAPRTMFKPDEGMAYWEEQKAREEKRQASKRNRNDDEA
jgi:pyocin large subunit-like protein